VGYGFFFFLWLRFPLPVYAMLFSAGSLDGSLGGMMNGIACILHVLGLGVAYFGFREWKELGKGSEMRGTAGTCDHVW
jgi:hypothetical protein